MRVSGFQVEIVLHWLAIWFLLCARLAVATESLAPSTTAAIGTSEPRLHKPRHFGFPQVQHAVENAESGQFIEIDMNVGHVAHGGDRPFPYGPPPTILPVSPYSNQTLVAAQTATITLPDGSLLEIEQHVSMAFGGAPLPSSVTDAAPPAVDESASPHLISIELSSPPPMNTHEGQSCAGRGTVTITRTVQVTSTQTSIYTRYATSTRTITRVRTGIKAPKPEPQVSFFYRCVYIGSTHVLGFDCFVMSLS